MKVEFIKYFKLYRKISLSDLTKVGLNLIHCAYTIVSEMKPRDTKAQKAQKSPSSYQKIPYRSYLVAKLNKKENLKQSRC
jgi:hypothetical protein